MRLVRGGAGPKLTETWSIGLEHRKLPPYRHACTPPRADLHRFPKLWVPYRLVYIIAGLLELVHWVLAKAGVEFVPMLNRRWARLGIQLALPLTLLVYGVVSRGDGDLLWPPLLSALPHQLYV